MLLLLAMSVNQFLGRAATHSLGLYGDNLLEACFLVGHLCFGQITFSPLSHHSKIHHQDYIEGILISAKMGGTWQSFDGDSRVCSHCTSPEMVYRKDMAWRPIHRPTNASQMLDGLVSASKLKFQCLHRSQFWVDCVLCLSEAG